VHLLLVVHLNERIGQFNELAFRCFDLLLNLRIDVFNRSRWCTAVHGVDGVDSCGDILLGRLYRRRLVPAPRQLAQMLLYFLAFAGGRQQLIGHEVRLAMRTLKLFLPILGRYQRVSDACVGVASGPLARADGMTGNEKHDKSLVRSTENSLQRFM
jgi:hypothetical protein